MKTKGTKFIVAITLLALSKGEMSPIKRVQHGNFPFTNEYNFRRIGGGILIKGDFFQLRKAGSTLEFTAELEDRNDPLVDLVVTSLKIKSSPLETLLLYEEVEHYDITTDYQDRSEIKVSLKEGGIVDFYYDKENRVLIFKVTPRFLKAIREKKGDSEFIFRKYDEEEKDYLTQLIVRFESD